MKMHITRIAALLLLVLYSLNALANEKASEQALNLDEVLFSTSTHFPKILQSMADFRAAESRALGAEGAFDLVFDVNSYAWAEGFYDGRNLEGTASRYLRSYGAQVYGGYSVSNGSFPIYEDKRFTNTGGQMELGVLFSILRDRDIDSRRFQESDARLATREARLDVLLTRIGVAQQAVVSYWRWVALGQKQQVYNELLELALARQTGLKREVESGARPRIVLTENLQNITRRKSLLATAKRDFNVAANELSLYYRDEAGNPKTVSSELLPQYSPKADISTDITMRDMEAVLDIHPELKRVRNEIMRTVKQIKLNENDLLPKLDLQLEVAQPLGTIGEGGISRDETDVIVGLQFSVPLEQRKARGALSESKAELSSLKQRERLIQDKIQLQVKNILLDLQASQELLKLANDEVNQSEILRDAEHRRFQQGASDFFLVNVREETAAEARIKYLLAGLQRETARASFDAATVNLSKLGITASLY